MKKSLSILLAAITALVFLASGVFAAPAETEYYIGLTEADALKDAPRDGKVRPGLELAETPELAVFSTVLAVPLDEGEEGLSIDLSCEGNGPESFAVNEDGSIAILDSLSCRIMVYGSSGHIRSYDIPKACYPYRMTESSRAYFVLDTSDKIIRIDKKTGEASFIVPYEGFSCYDVLWMASAGKCVYYCGRDYKYRAIEGMLPEDAANGVKHVFSIKKNNERDMGDSFMWLGADRTGSSYFLHGKDVKARTLSAEFVISRYDKHGMPEAYALLRPEENEFVPTDNYFISPDGAVYVMACMDGCAAVFQVTLGSDYESHEDELRERAEQIASGVKPPERETKTEVVTVIELSQSSVPPAIAIRPFIRHILLLKRSFIPYHYEDPFCRIFFRVILQAPG